MTDMASRKRGLVALALLGLAILIAGIWFRSRSQNSREAVRNEASSTVEGVGKPGNDDSKEISGEKKAPSLGSRLMNSGEVKTWLQSLYPKHKLASQSSRSSSGRFHSEQSLYLREARLAALAYPAETEAVATPIAFDQSLDKRSERYLAIVMLGFVARGTGGSTAMATLQTLLRDSDKGAADTALAAIAGTDIVGARKDLYWEGCRRGSLTAFEISSYWYDSGTISELRSLVANGGNHHAERVLRRMEILSSANWEDTVGTMLRDVQSPLDTDIYWALTIAGQRKSAHFLTEMRARLDLGMLEARKQWSAPGEGVPRSGSFDHIYSYKAELDTLMKDRMHDHVLVAYWEAGGQLTAVEKARLRTFGYACDPKQRLTELMTSEK